VQLRDEHLLLNLQVGHAGDAFHRGLSLAPRACGACRGRRRRS
jgi:hypothetical protein